MNEKSFDCLALSLVPGLGHLKTRELIRQVGSPGELLELSVRELEGLRLSPEARAFMASGCARRAGEDALRQCREKGIGLLSVFDDAYPHLLKQIFDPPLVLYCLGDLDVLKDPSIAVVGSRRCSIYGKEITRNLAREIASVGLSIVSGMARGIDSQAHRGALEAGGPTIAVLGNGIDVVYPRENRSLYRRICGKGCVISEFALGSFPAPQNFPIRNRIISGLCYGTVITEASEFSGSLITARLTLEQNRELWAVPGNITNPGSYGPNYLLKQGAKIVLDRQDILEELPLYVLDLLSADDSDSAEKQGEKVLNQSEQGVLRLLSVDSAVQFDRLLKKSDMGVAELNGVLLQLEVKGLIRQWPGRQFSRRS